MRAAIDQRKDLVICCSKNGDRRRSVGARDAACATARDVVEASNLDPASHFHRSADFSQDAIFVLGSAGSALRPGVDLYKALREQKAPVQVAAQVGILDDFAAYIIDAY